MLKEILNKVEVFNSHIAYLKIVSPVFPDIYYEEKGGCIWATTIVEYDYNGVRYRRHHVESIIPTKSVNKEWLTRKIINSAEMCLKMAVPCRYDDVVGIISKPLKDKNG